MQNYCNLNSEIIAINHVIPDPAQFTNCLKYLNLSKHFKVKEKDFNVVDEVQKVAGEHNGEIVSNTLTTAEERIIKKLRDEINELNARYDYMKKEYRSNFLDIGNIIGANEDLENLIYKPNSKFWVDFRKKNAILAKISAVDLTITKKEERIINLQKYIEVSIPNFLFANSNF
jgi:hypothetical protein